MFFWSKLTDDILRNISNIYLEHYFDNENTILDIVMLRGAKKRHFPVNQKKNKMLLNETKIYFDFKFMAELEPFLKVSSLNEARSQVGAFG